MKVDLSKAIAHPKLSEPVVYEELQKIMKKHYSAGIWSDIKRTLVTNAIVIKERRKA